MESSEESEYHVFPEDDGKEHLGSELCWCKPYMCPYDPEEQVRIWIHNYLH